MHDCKSRQTLGFLGFILLFLSTLLHPVASQAETIEVGILQSAPVQKIVLVRHAKQFEDVNPDIQVKLNFYSDADFKVALAEWLESSRGPDIVTWQGGQRLYQYVEQNQVEDLSAIWSKYNLHSNFAEGAVKAVSLNNRRYAIPVSYYQWGFYYRRSVFQTLGLSEPSSWQEFLNVCETLKNAGITPITIGAKNKWTSAAWFDYLNLRINGLDYHQRLLQGEISFNNAGVKNVFKKWKQLLDSGYFVDRYNGWTWSEAMPYMYHKMAGMTLIGNFFAGAMPTTLRDDFGFFRFPIIDSKQKIYEEAPLDLYMVPKYVNLNSSVERFLVSLSSTEFQQTYNEGVGMISPNIKVRSNSDYFIQEGQRTLKQAAGVSQFFDRDTNADMAGAATAIFTDFMDHKNISKTINELEIARQKFLL